MPYPAEEPEKRGKYIDKHPENLDKEPYNTHELSIKRGYSSSGIW